MVVIDSIQTMWLDSIESAPGTVAQVRACSFELIRLAKSRGFALVLVGHVTKDGSIAGPRVLEHMVDAVLHFEGDRGHQFRILRGVKNRFGATDEIGVFEMTELGLAEVPNPSALFLAERRGNISGSAVFAGLEGTRPVLLEVQALLAPNPGGSPRRSVVGWDGGRLSMLLAVLESRCGLRLNATDVYLNVAGGLRVSEPAADLAVAAAIASAAGGPADQPGDGLFRRDRPVGRGAAGGAGRGAAEGGGQARLRRGLPAAPGGARQPAAGRARGAAAGRDRALVRPRGAVRRSPPPRPSPGGRGHASPLPPGEGWVRGLPRRRLGGSRIREDIAPALSLSWRFDDLGGPCRARRAGGLRPAGLHARLRPRGARHRRLGRRRVWWRSGRFPTPGRASANGCGTPDLVDPVTFAVVFIVTLLVLLLICHWIGALVRGSVLGGVDRTLGLVFGLVRGAALVVFAYIAAGLVIPVDRWPEPVLQARSLPVAYAGAAWAAAQLPPDYRPKLQPPPAGRQTTAEDLLRATPQGGPPAVPSHGTRRARNADRPSPRRST